MFTHVIPQNFAVFRNILNSTDDREANAIFYTIVKRGLDIVLSLMFSILFLPIFGIIALVIRADSNGPVIFRQQRIGRFGKPFTIYKFRTMFTATPADLPTAAVPHPQQYITAVGRYLRQTSLDELPQLFNVLRGDMSFVGPRPVIPNETQLLMLRKRYRADRVRPGITGLAQIRGRDELSARIKARYDAEYAKNCTFLLDCYIFFSTLRYVLRREGIREGSADLYKKR